MLLKHAGLTCSTEGNADKFYRDLLGLNKSEPKTLPADLAQAIFNLDAELQMINYIDDHIHFEIFITPQSSTSQLQIDHLCLEVADLAGFIAKCRSMQVEVALIPKGDKTLTFIKDFDGNLFEITQQKSV
jgi:catechol 2,3-dioxygenase-like lactoylglutathione lyase family enzyme